MDIVMLSGIRKEILLYLDDGPRSLSDIKEHLDITSPEVSPRLKELLEHNTIRFEGKKYKLTPMGRAIVKKLQPFLDTINVFDQYPDWWAEHDLSSIPVEFLNRIGELKNFIIIEDDIDDMNRTYKELQDLINSSKYILGVSCVFDHNLIEPFLNLAKNNGSVSLIVTDKAFDIIDTKYHHLINEFLNTGNTGYINKEVATSYIVTEDCLFFSLYYSIGKFDFHSNLVSNDLSSIKWGTDLFEFYKSKSVKIN